MSLWGVLRDFKPHAISSQLSLPPTGVRDVSSGLLLQRCLPAYCGDS